MRRRPPPKRPAPAIDLDLIVERLGTEGAGLARQDGRTILLPDTLPGERVRARVIGERGRVLTRLSDSDARIDPACPHFGRCGGCALQHAGPGIYAEFKRMLVADALSRQGLGAVEVMAPLLSPPGSRRRATLVAIRGGRQVRLGFHMRASHDVIDVAACPVLRPELAALLPAIRGLLAGLLIDGQPAPVSLCWTEAGVDLGLVLPAIPDLGDLEALSAFARTYDLARLWWRGGEGTAIPAAQHRAPIVRFGGVPVELPPGGFLQATAEGEAALTAAVLAHLGPARRVADLYAGVGTFTLALGDAVAVHAVETDEMALAALAKAIRRAERVRLTTERRDLEARPLLAAELKSYDAVVFDPPRAGARAQVEMLAASAVPVIVAVSCNPASFARDAATLVAGGYTLERVQPVDQFLWSQHIELVAAFRRS